MFYTRRSTYKRTLHILDISCIISKELGVDLKVEGVRYIEMHRYETIALGLLKKEEE